jgi:SOS-response transcriptional repressor LexA
MVSFLYKPLTGELSFTIINLPMKSNDAQECKFRSRIMDISSFYREKDRMPSFSEIGEMTGLKSKNAVSKLINKLEGLGILERDEKGRLIPRSIAGSVRVLGTVEAGFPETQCPGHTSRGHGDN